MRLVSLYDYVSVGLRWYVSGLEEVSVRVE